VEAQVTIKVTAQEFDILRRALEFQRDECKMLADQHKLNNPKRAQEFRQLSAQAGLLLTNLR